jgi:hypothetical protein
VSLRIAVAGLVVTLAAACGESPEQSDAARSPAPRVAPTVQPEEGFDEAPGEAAGPPAPADKAASRICDGIGEAATAESPEDFLRDLARTAARKGVQFHRLITLLQRAFATGDTEKAYGYIDRLAGICEDVTGRRNF